MDIRITSRDSILIDRLRGASILRVVLSHLGLSWFLLPYSSYIGIFLSVLFFCSGYLFIHIFFRCRSLVSYWVRRVASILVPFYILYLLSVIAFSLYFQSQELLNAGHLFRALLVAPAQEEMPYPLGQIWYLRVLIFCAVVSPAFFYPAARNRYFLLIPVGIAALLSVFQTIDSFHSELAYFGHSLYQEIVYGGYFFVGSFIYCLNWRDSRLKLAVAAVGCFLLAVLTHQYTNGAYDLREHAYAPNIFFFSLGAGCIFLVLWLAPVFEWIYNNIKIVDWILAYNGRYSYGVYLTHSFFIVFVEAVFGWENVMSNPPIAALKVVFVIAASMAAAYPLHRVSRQLLDPLRRRF